MKKKHKRKICVVTASRAEYGHLYYLMKEIAADNTLKLQIIAMGAHLSKKFGLTYKNIEADGFKIQKKITTLQFSDTDEGITKSIGRGCISLAEAFRDMKPELVLILGDRYEMLSAAIAAYIAKIPIIHIHGGETTQGAIDEAIRHAISKMACIHFTATERYRKRLIQLGESPKSVFNFGSPGLDYLYKIRFPKRKELSNILKFELTDKIALCTYHPVTLEKNSSKIQIKNLLKAIDTSNLKVIFTSSNADSSGTVINEAIKKHCCKFPQKYKFFHNLGSVNYFGCLKNFDLLIGNSSSGIIEAPSFKIPVVNIGERQKGRLKAVNIIDCGYSTEEIIKAINKALSNEFKNSLSKMTNFYDEFADGKNSYRIKKQIKILKITPDLIKKRFYDIEFHDSINNLC